jgi:transposase
MLKVREFTQEEQRLLESKIQDKKLSARIYQRYQIIWQRSKGIAPGEISSREHLHPHTIRFWVRRFNREGFEYFEKRENVGGRPPRINKETKLKIIQTVLSRPEDLGLPFTGWSLTKLQEYLLEEEIVSSISTEGIRKILLQNGISYQRTKTWMSSPDPEFELKKTVFSPSMKIHQGMGK